MNQFRLSTDILSPLQSDVSLNDTSVFTYGNLSGTPECEREIKTPKYESSDKDSNVDSFCKRTMKESAAAFDIIVNDIKKQSNINAAKEERFKESYEMLKHSMDDLYYKISHPSVLSPISNDRDLKSMKQTENMPSEEEMNEISEAPQKLIKDSGKNVSTKSKTSSHNSSRKSKKKEESKVSNKMKESNQQSKNICTIKESIESKKHSKKKSYLENEKDAKREYLEYGLQNLKESKTVSSSTQTCEDFEAVRATENENLKNYYSRKQRKAAESNSLPEVETKSLSIEKSIQIALSMEMDNLRRFILEQNVCLRKDLLKLQETAKKQGEVTGYLFSVIEELMEENKKLFSKSN